MVMRDFDTLWDRKTYISIKENFKELFNYYIKSGLDAAEAREKAIQAVADAEIAKETAEVTREEMLAIIREQTSGGDVVPEVVQARGGKATLGERLNSIDSDLAQIPEHINNAVDPKADKIDVEQIAITINDIVFDGETDNYADLQAIINSGAGELVFPYGKDIHLSQPLELSQSKIKVVDFRDSHIYAPNGSIVDNRHYSDKALLRNGILDGVTQQNGSIGVSLGTERSWGTSMKFENIYIRRYKIGLYGQSVFNLDPNNLRVRYCGIGVYLHNNESPFTFGFSNLNRMPDLYIQECKYGFYTHDTQSSLFDNHTYEFNDYPIVLGKELRNIEIKNPWFENNNIANVTAGTIDLDTLELTKHDHERYFEEVKFVMTRYNTDNTKVPMFDPHYKFVSKYFSFGGNRDNIENTFSYSPFNYKNLVYNLRANVNNGGDNSSVTYKDTPFGKLRVANARFLGSENGRLARYVATIEPNDIKMNNTYLLKALVYVEKPNDPNTDHIINMQLTNSSDLSIHDTWTTDFRVLTDKWVEVSVLALVNNSDRLGSTEYRVATFFDRAFGSERPNDPLYNDLIDVSVTNVMVVNLTDIFGEDVPKEGMARYISKYFPYKFPYILPQGRYVGDMTFDRSFNRNKIVTWNGTEWTDALGEPI